MENYNKEHGTALDMLRVLSIRQSGTRDYITYQYEWKSRYSWSL